MDCNSEQKYQERPSLADIEHQMMEQVQRAQVKEYKNIFAQILSMNNHINNDNQDQDMSKSSAGLDQQSGESAAQTDSREIGKLPSSPNQHVSVLSYGSERKEVIVSQGSAAESDNSQILSIGDVDDEQDEAQDEKSKERLSG